MQPGGQSIVDRFLAAKNTIAGQPVAKVVCKATTEELIGPKRKHLDCELCTRRTCRSPDACFRGLLQATHEMNVSIPEIADLLIERSQNSSWIVSFKSLITIHHLMAYGNEVKRRVSHVGIRKAAVLSVSKRTWLRTTIICNRRSTPIASD